jgi:hypothetical protein
MDYWLIRLALYLCTIFKIFRIYADDFNQDISSWKVDSVTECRGFSTICPLDAYHPFCPNEIDEAASNTLGGCE